MKWLAVLPGVGLLLSLLSFGTTTAAPDIELVPDSLEFELAAGDTGWSSFTIRNLGDAPLDFQLGIPSSGIIIIAGPSGAGSWISLHPRQGQVPPGGSSDIGVRFDARELSPTWPQGAAVLISSNDPDEPQLDYLVRLTLLPWIPVPATLELKPAGLNLARGAPWLTAWIELPAPFEPRSIITSSVRLAGIAPLDPDRFAIRDQDHNGVPELSLKFDRSAVAGALGTGTSVEARLEGILQGGRPFSGMALVMVSGGLEPTVAIASGTTFLGQNRPNPFNPTTHISYSLKTSTDVTLHVYDMAGRLVRVLVDQWQSAGAHETGWDGRNETGQPVASGFYVYRLHAGGYQEWRRMALLK